MIDTARIGALIRGTNDKNEDNVFKDIICDKSPFGQVYGPPFLASYCGYNSGTIGNRYAVTVW